MATPVKPQVGLMLIKPMYIELNRLSKIVDFFQVPGEDYFGPQAVTDYVNLSAIANIKPLHVHSIDLSLGSADGVNQVILEDIAKVATSVPTVSFSDHIGFSKVGEYWTGMPMINPPLTIEAVNAMSHNISAVKKVIGNKPFYVENNSHCIDWPNSEISESKFTNLLIKNTGAKILLDIPNMLADARNYGFDPYVFIESLELKEVEMVHLAGGDWLDGYKDHKITRGHNKRVEKDTWDLFKYVLNKCPIKYIVLERSRDINYDEISLDLKKLRELIFKTR